MTTSPTTSPTRDWLFVLGLRLDVHTDVAENTIVATYCFEAKPFSRPDHVRKELNCVRMCILTGQNEKESERKN
ncbi:hypothetical protein I7I53_08569 [Histoplasma capsulatum var. duboisii H88]|uniref:Uncharacterized protein n=1 Tax=Ajellomyces capsulatus (strain H88) TaxID=544711 RepID=A0A8A1LLF3_AJEC8|nr:hypothetical protein I7I53_08569 [Histoplasma capsulatum var. duboisii H88]